MQIEISTPPMSGSSSGVHLLCGFKASQENCDSILFLGGKEESTLKSISEQLGKETIDIRGHNRTKGKSPTTSENNSIVGRELLQINEVGVIPTTDCILMMRGQDPYYCKKYVLEEHPNYRFSGDADKAYRFDLTQGQIASKCAGVSDTLEYDVLACNRSADHDAV